jgi:lysozyme
MDEELSLCMALCLRFEGLYLRPYLCPAGVPTIGCGSTRYLDGTAVTLTDPPITREHAMHLLRERLLRDFLPGVLRLAGAIDTPGRLAALTDLAYNIGLGNLRASTLLRVVRAGKWDEAPAQFRRWNKGGGRVLAGLTKRREAEISLL